MIFWVDENLPFRLCKWIRADTPHDSYTMRDLNLSETDDQVIFARAKGAAESLPAGEHIAIITKDWDFVELIERHGAPPAIVLVLVGNIRNADIIPLFERILPQVVELIASGETIVHIQ